MNNFGRTEKTILAVALAVLLLASYFLYDDSLLFPTAAKSQNELIGSVATSQNDVRRKNSDAFSWYPASSKDSVFQHDSIFTGDGSSASIRLKDGSTIELQPNSLITLNIKDGQMTLDLRYGNLVGDITKNSSLVIKSGSEEFKLGGDNSKIEFNKSRNGGMDVKLLEGKGNILGKGGKAIEVAPKEKPELILDTPSGTNVVKTKEAKPVNLKWSSKGKIAKYEMELSKDPEFKEILSKSTTQEKEFAVEQQDLPPGTYSWRVKAYDSSGKVVKTSAANTFTISSYPPPTITSPAPDSVVDLEMRASRPEDLVADTKVTWTTPDPNYKKFHFQIAKDAEFKELIKNIDTPLLESASPKLPNGTYFARVQAKLDDKGLYSEWSVPVSFRLNLVAKKAPSIPAPVLVTNDIKFKHGQKNARDPSAVSAPVVEWKPVSQAKTYRLQIDQDKKFSQPADYNVKDTKAAWSQYRPGKYYYRVYSVDENGDRSAPSTVGEMRITADSPVVKPVPPITKRAQPGQAIPPKEQDVKISWSEVPFAKKYRVELDTSDKFDEPTKFEFPASSGVVKLPNAGHYHVRVQALDEHSQVISDYSNKQDLLYSFAEAALPSPTPSEPFDKTSIFMQQEASAFIWLEWKSVNGAKTYRIEVSNTPDFSKKIVSQTTNSSRFLIKEKIPVGKVFWRVRAEGGDENLDSDWSPKREFILYHQKNETFVK